MNVVYIHTHDTGRYIQPYGYGLETPNLMNLAKSGTLFRQAFCSNPTCSPSRASLLTGMWAHSTGLLGLTHRGFEMNDNSRHLVHFMNRKNYETVLCGVQHETDGDPKSILGYQKVLNHEKKGSTDFTTYDLSNAEKVADYITEKKKGNFFLSFGMMNTHRIKYGFQKRENGVNPNYVIPPAPIYDTEVTREDWADYINEAIIVDQCVGIVMDALEKSEKNKNTLVIFTTDHGLAFPQMKCTLYDSGIGVSLIMKYYGNKLAGKVVDSLVSQVDLFPTICSLIGETEPEWLQGQSLYPLLNCEKKSVRNEIFSEVNYHASYDPQRSIRTDRYKLIRYYDKDFERKPMANIDDGLSKDFFSNAGFNKAVIPREMLFDLYLDPSERENLIDNEEYQEIYDDLSQRLEQWMIETEDPIIEGKIIMPSGAIVHHKECYSNTEQRLEK